MILASIVGTQIMAVLSPACTLLEEEFNKEGLLFLMATSRTIEVARKIEEFIASRYENVSVEVAHTSAGLEPEAPDLPPAHEVFAGFTSKIDDPVYFNVAGGMNFQIAAILYSIKEKLDRLRIVYPERYGVHVFKLEGTKLSYSTKHHVVSISTPEQIMDLQGLDWKPIESGLPANFVKWARKNGLIIPPGISVNIGGNVFEHVFQKNNELYLIGKLLNVSKAETRLKRVRKLLDFSQDRHKTAELYHKSILILTDNPMVKEHLEKDSGGKIEIVMLDKNGHPGMNDFEKIKSFFTSNVLEMPSISLPKLEPIESKVVYTVLGKDPMPTLQALKSHKTGGARLIVTSGDSSIENSWHRIQKLIPSLPQKRLQKIPVSFNSHEILSHVPPEPPEQLVVNITPGTKLQTAFLTIWAVIMGNIPVYSIKTDDRFLRRIPDNARGPKRATPTPVEVLTVRMPDVDILRHGRDKGFILKNEKFYQQMLSFIKSIINSSDPQSLIDKLCGRIPFVIPDVLKCDFLGPSKSKMDISVLWEGCSEPIQWSLLNNTWFEELVAYSIVCAGATNVHVNIKLGTDFNGNQHDFSEIDVVAGYENEIYVISCKSGKDSEDSWIEEVNAVAKQFGRFAHAMLAKLAYLGEPTVAGNVVIFGPRTIVDPERMKEALKLAADIKRTTRSGETGQNTS